MEIENRVRYYRKLMGMSIRDIHWDVGVSYSTYQRIENGDSEPKLSMAMKLAEYFQVPLDVLFFKKGTNPKRFIPEHIHVKLDSNQN